MLVIIKQGHEITKEEIAIMERGWPRCYSKEEVFLELVKIGVLKNIQLHPMLFLIKDLTKVRTFFWCSNWSITLENIIQDDVWVILLKGWIIFSFVKTLENWL